MAYQTAIKIKDVVNNIQKLKYVLPSIQREFVWQPNQIEQLFDSIMRGYPISTFLFWNVEKSRIKDFQFYEFLKNYHEKDCRHNTKASLSHDEDVIAILDGQQRLTSLYLALKGTYAKKLPYYQWDSAHAFPKKKLYLNLLKPADDVEMEYDFRFLSDDEAKPKEDYHWFQVGKILEYDDLPGVMQYLMLNGLMDTSKYSTEQANFALNTLSKFFNKISQEGTISYYLEQGETLDKVLQIFIRINSGGTKLSYSDLLLSVATAQWEHKDAREEIHRFVDEINKIGEGFNFDKDFVLKSCLVLGDFSDVRFKVDNFKKENMLHIENSWQQITNAIRTTIELYSSFGFNRDNLTSTNTVIPVAYYILKKDIDNAVVTSASYGQDRKLIKEWLVRTLLKRVFSGTPDALYPKYRNVISEHSQEFPLQQIIDRFKGTNKSIVFSEDDIENLLNMEYRRPLTYSALTLLYPGLNTSFRYHQDHIHPQSFFTEAKLRREGITDVEQQRVYQARFNKLPNLQLLQATQNTEKNGKKLKDWLQETHPNQHSQDVYKQQHLFPQESLEFADFVPFFDIRKELIREKLYQALGVEPKVQVSETEPLESEIEII